MITKEEDLQQMAGDILEKYPQERLFAFFGEMGVGKTTLIKEICKKLTVIDQTSSPTFAIINEYYTAKQEPVYHFDFYRIEKKEDLLEIGVTEYLNSGCYCLMEWPENAGDLLGDHYIKICMQMGDHNQRIITF